MRQSIRILVALAILVVAIALCPSGVVAKTVNPAVNYTPYDVVSVKLGTSEFKVEQQPKGVSPGYITTGKEALTLFTMAAKRNNVGLLAHSYLAGKYFYSLEEGQKIVVTYKDGVKDTYVVSDVLMYQVNEPTNPSSDFTGVDVDLNRIAGTRTTASELFYKTYAEGKLVLQTCIEQDGNLSWGRFFVVADKYVAENRFE